DRRLAFGDAGDAHALGLCLVGQADALLDCGKQRFARAVSGFRATGHAVGVGKVAGHGIEAHGLRRHARPRDIEYGEQGHQPWPPVMAACSTCSSTVLPSIVGWLGTRYSSAPWAALAPPIWPGVGVARLTPSAS